MSIYIPVADEIRAAMAKAGGGVLATDFPAGSVSVSGCRLATPQEVTTHGKNSRAWANSTSGAPLKDRIEIFYNRRDLKEIARMYTAQPEIPVGTSVYTLFSALYKQTGIRFTQDDLAETFVTTSDEGRYVDLTAKDASSSFIGTFRFPIQETAALSSNFTTTTLAGF